MRYEKVYCISLAFLGRQAAMYGRHVADVIYSTAVCGGKPGRVQRHCLSSLRISVMPQRVVQFTFNFWIYRQANALSGCGRFTIILLVYKI